MVLAGPLTLTYEAPLDRYLVVSHSASPFGLHQLLALIAHTSSVFKFGFTRTICRIVIGL